ncbi:transcriptional regulator, LacI family [Fictibacillus solisalsi]|uniref:Transcriptional regulator, LacI family n=1 Tax=Fictibacillus solisalsi TaxID=459525 RepID=A0A1G9U230_9BACL|nr:LacI family DNA-binding transcriptional regulator [Fictibacillus solisalsi]SDM53972.1 transcriptional regulator, LacI family [Fictibacillus solisalsi]
MVSIKDIAKQAGVSISTVSYALNGSQKVTQETTAKILAIAKELNYIPNAAARTLKKRETKIAGVYLTNYSGAFYGELQQGMLDQLAHHGYELIVCSGKESHRFLPEGMIDGAIILDAHFSNKELLSYADRGHKLVVLDRELQHENITQVLLDNKTGAKLAVDHAAELGHRKLYIVTGPKGSFDSSQRLQQALLTAEKNGMECTVIQGDFNKASGEQAGRKMMEEYSGPAAAFCLNDEMAIGMYNALSGTAYNVGEHVHIIGFDNIEVAQYTHPRLTTIDYSKREWGAAGAEQLIKLIKKESSSHKKVGVTLSEGESIRRL